MSNTKLKEGLGEIAREVAVLPGVTSADASFVGEKVLTISAKIDKTNGLDPSGLPQQVGTVNPTATPSMNPVVGKFGRGVGPGGILGLLSAVPFVAELASGVADWLGNIGIADHEQKLDEEQSNHSDTLDNLQEQSSECAGSVKEIDETADRGMQEIVDVLLGLIASLKSCPLVQLGSAALSSICEGLSSIESTVDDRNKSIGECFDGLKKLCEDAGGSQPPAPKQYCSSGESSTPPPACPPEPTAPAASPPPAPAPAPAPTPSPAPAPAPEVCPTTPAHAPQPQPQSPAPAPAPAPSPGAVPQPVPECPPTPVPASSPLPSAELTPAKTPPTPQVTVPATTGSGLNINIAIDANLACPPPAVTEIPATPTTPANCPESAVPAPPAVPPVGPAGECIVQQVVAGIEAFGQSVAECLSQIECPVDPVADCPPPAPAPEPEPIPVSEPECPEPQPEPAPKPEPECPEEAPAPKPEPEPVGKPECPDGTIAPPPELAEVKEPPPPPKKGLVAPMAADGMAAPPEAAPAPEPAPAPAGDGAPADAPAEKQPDNHDDQQRARKTGGW